MLAILYVNGAKFSMILYYDSLHLFLSLGKLLK